MPLTSFVVSALANQTLNNPPLEPSYSFHFGPYTILWLLIKYTTRPKRKNIWQREGCDQQTLARERARIDKSQALTTGTLFEEKNNFINLKR